MKYNKLIIFALLQIFVLPVLAQSYGGGSTVTPKAISEDAGVVTSQATTGIEGEVESLVEALNSLAKNDDSNKMHESSQDLRKIIVEESGQQGIKIIIDAFEVKESNDPPDDFQFNAYFGSAYGSMTQEHLNQNLQGKQNSRAGEAFGSITDSAARIAEMYNQMWDLEENSEAKAWLDDPNRNPLPIGATILPKNGSAYQNFLYGLANEAAMQKSKMMRFGTQRKGNVWIEFLNPSDQLIDNIDSNIEYEEIIIK